MPDTPLTPLLISCKGVEHSRLLRIFHLPVRNILECYS